jgi:hypothetical protein
MQTIAAKITRLSQIVEFIWIDLINAPISDKLRRDALTKVQTIRDDIYELRMLADKIEDGK